MRYDALLVLLGLLFSATPASAQVSVGIGLPGVSIGINLPVVPGARPGAGLPGLLRSADWTRTFSSTTACTGCTRGITGTRAPGTTGPGGSWARRSCRCSSCEFPCATTGLRLRTFADGGADAPPRWGEHWGHEWEQRRSGWDRWNRGSVPAPAPLPVYQRQYSGDRYPRVEQQQALQRQKYRYQPQDPVVRQVQQERRSRSRATAGSRTTRLTRATSAPARRLSRIPPPSCAHRRRRLEATRPKLHRPLRQSSARGPRRSRRTSAGSRTRIASAPRPPRRLRVCRKQPRSRRQPQLRRPFRQSSAKRLLRRPCRPSRRGSSRQGRRQFGRSDPLRSPMTSRIARPRRKSRVEGRSAARSRSEVRGATSKAAAG